MPSSTSTPLAPARRSDGATRRPLGFVILGFVIFLGFGILGFGISAADAAPAASAAGAASAAAAYLVNTWKTDNGLPQNWVTSIAQTPDGYLWIGTRYGGLARFDGLRFALFTPQNTPGLRDMQIERLTLDSRGTLWIATADCSITALRDGRFELFRRTHKNAKMRLATVLRAGDDAIAFGTETSTIMRLDPAKGLDGWGVFTPPLAEKPRAYNIYPPQTFHRDRDGNYWYIDQRRQLACATEKGKALALPDALRAALPASAQSGGSILLPSEGAGSPPHFEAAAAAPPRVNALAADSRGDIWIVTDTQILSWDGHAATDRTPKNTPAPNALDDTRQIAFAPDGGIWFAGKQHLRKLSPSTNTWLAEADPRPLPEIMSSRHCQLHADSRGGAWIVSYGHGLLHARADGSTRILTEKDGLPSTLLTCWFEDTESNIWVGTTGDGFARIRERAFHVIGPDEGMPGKIICTVGADARGDIWAGANSGQLTRWANATATVLPLPADGATPPDGIALWPARDGDIWASSPANGLVRLHDGKPAAQIQLRGPKPIRVLFEDSRGALWIGRTGGLCRYAAGKIDYFEKPQTNQATSPTPPTETAATTAAAAQTPDAPSPNVAVSAIAEDAAGVIWIGTVPGDLWRYRDGVFTYYPHPAGWPRARCVSLQPDPDAPGVIWMGTLGNGLVRFDAENARFTRFQKTEGVPDDNISQLLDDHAGNLWCGSYSGIYRIPKTELAKYLAGKSPAIVCSAYGREDGLPALECTTGFNPACWRAADARLLFATVNGIVTVNPRDMMPNLQPPRVIIEELHVDGKPVPLAGRAVSPKPPRLSSDILGGFGDSNEATGLTTALPPPATAHDALEIEPGKHFLQFRYTGLSYSAPRKVGFLWKLDGVNNTWQNAGRQREIGIGPLAPGAYRLHVRAVNADGIWSEADATLAFRVRPNLWETAWFRATAATLVLALIVLAVVLAQRRRYHRRLREAERQRHLEQERARIARDLHDDLGTSLMQISLLSTLANGPKTPPAEKAQIIDRVDNRAREMIGALDEIVWAVNPKNDTWYELANYLGFYAEEFFRPTNIRCRMSIPDSSQLPQTPLPSETRHHLFLAFKEAINNVAKHSGAAQAWVRVESDAAEVRITVEDDGKGFASGKETAPPTDPTRPAGGNGLPNMRRRMEQIGGACELAPGSGGRGARVVFRAPR